ncbi:cytochrome P450 [Crepidotus variabilis]|uniref:Cytochrome P450 n=1 Tax=Crepidotus variabilis TaxID=179855 RepID=A0A9P6JSR0_9AGAR|nr:cytochrome P450 [Crepidotus variabilis]
MGILAYSLGALLFLGFLRLLRGRRHLPYPPGPPKKFFFENASDFPRKALGQVFTQWGRMYNSDILHACAFGRHLIVINNRDIAEDLFERRASLYNDRPWVAILPLLGWEFNISFLAYGETWRQHRRVCQQYFHPEAAMQYYPIQLERTRQFLNSMLQTPEKAFDHSKQLSVSITLKMMYGYTPKSLNDPVVNAADESTALGLSLIVFGSYITFLPILRFVPAWVPGTYAVNAAKKVKQLTQDMQRLPMEGLENSLRDGIPVTQSLMNDFLEKKATSGATEEEEKIFNNVAWTTYGAASDTTIAATESLFYLIVLHPGVQRRAQEEIDRVVGKDRLPDFNDRPSLPYIEAIYRELMRHSPPLPTGVPHALMEDDTYNGYFLPKGASVMSNIWAMTRDAEIYPDPDAFKPERFLNKDGKLNDDSRILAYGFGRRVCVGKAVASSTMWLTIVSLLACFDFTKARDEFGNEIEVNDEYDDSNPSIRHKKPFRFAAKVRSDQARRLIEENIVN